MREGLSGDDIFAELMMLRTADARTFVLLEGPSDCRALDPHIESHSARTLPAYSKSALERTVALVDERDFERTLGILDRDWVDVIHAPVESDNLVYTDDYDLDATILLSGDVLERLVSSVTNRDQRESHLGKMASSVEDSLVTVSARIGIGRMISTRDGYGVKFEGFPVKTCLDLDSGEVDVGTLATIAVSRSKAPRVQASELADLIDAHEFDAEECRMYCSGHDLAATMVAFIRNRWGGGSISRDTVENMARAALGCEDLKSMSFFEAVKDWAMKNKTTVWSCS